MLLFGFLRSKNIRSLSAEKQTPEHISDLLSASLYLPLLYNLIEYPRPGRATRQQNLDTFDLRRGHRAAQILDLCLMVHFSGS